MKMGRNIRRGIIAKVIAFCFVSNAAILLLLLLSACARIQNKAIVDIPGASDILTYNRYSLSPDKRLLVVSSWRAESKSYVLDRCLVRIDEHDNKLVFERCFGHEIGQRMGFAGWSEDSRHVYFVADHKIIRYDVYSGSKEIVIPFEGKIDGAAVNSGSGSILFASTSAQRLNAHEETARVLMKCSLQNGLCIIQDDSLRNSAFYMWSEDGGVFVGKSGNLYFNNMRTAAKREEDEAWVYAKWRNNSLYFVTRSFLYGDDQGRLFFRYFFGRAQHERSGSREILLSFVASGSGVFLLGEDILFTEYVEDGFTKVSYIGLPGGEAEVIFLKGQYDSPILINSSIILRKDSGRLELIERKALVRQ